MGPHPGQNALPSHTPRLTPARATDTRQFTSLAHLWDAGENRNSSEETHTDMERTHKLRPTALAQNDFFFHRCYDETTSHETMLFKVLPCTLLLSCLLVGSFSLVLNLISRCFINLVWPKPTVFIKSTAVFSNAFGLHLHSPLTHRPTRSNFHSGELHSW